MITIYEAVVSVYPSAVTVYGNDVNSIVAHDINGNIVSVDLALISAKLTELQNAEIALQQAIETAKNSALAKLTALGLTANEIKALLGTA